MTERKHLLTDRQKEVLIAVSSGRPQVALEVELGITRQTIKNMLHDYIYPSLGINNRTRAIIEALRLGEIDLDEIPLTLTVKTAGQLGEHTYRRLLPQERTAKEL